MEATSAERGSIWKEKVQDLRKVVNKCRSVATKSALVRKAIYGKFIEKDKENPPIPPSDDFNHQFNFLIKVLHNELDLIDKNLDEIS